jgi:hypothetical protein
VRRLWLAHCPFKRSSGWRGPLGPGPPGPARLRRDRFRATGRFPRAAGPLAPPPPVGYPASGRRPFPCPRPTSAPLAQVGAGRERRCSQPDARAGLVPAGLGRGTSFFLRARLSARPTSLGVFLARFRQKSRRDTDSAPRLGLSDVVSRPISALICLKARRRPPLCLRHAGFAHHDRRLPRAGGHLY